MKERELKLVKVRIITSHFREGEAWIPVELYDEALKEKKSFQTYEFYTAGGANGDAYKSLCKYIFSGKSGIQKGEEIISIERLNIFKNPII